MNEQAILAMLKANLEKVNSVNDPYLVQLIQIAISEIQREGVVITVNDGVYALEDADLIVMYAAYLYRNRASGNRGYDTAALNPQGMPYMLRLRLNNRIFSGKMS